MKIILLGDCHGRLDLLHRQCWEAHQEYGIDAAIQVGDFGFFPKILHRFLHEGPRRFPVPVHAIDGNHEDHGWLTACRADGTLSGWEGANLFVHPRGSVAQLGGLSVGFIGGALHADRRQEWSGQWSPLADGSTPPRKRRVPRAPAWANWVTDGDVERTLAAFTATPPDLVVSHSCPASIGIGMVGAMQLIEDVDRFITRAGHHAGPFHDCGEGNLSALWRLLTQKPPLWVFGHFHRIHDRVIDGTRFICVGSADGSDGRADPPPLLLDTVTRSILVPDSHHDRMLS
jgi:predicted phosphodiesterase